MTARTAGHGRADRVQRIGLALAPAALPFGAAGFHDPDAGCRQVAGQPGTVAATALDADQANVPGSEAACIRGIGPVTGQFGLSQREREISARQNGLPDNRG